MWNVYVLRSDTFERFYTGMCTNIERRLTEHNSGKTKSTKGYKPWKIIHTEKSETRQEARNREK